MNKKLFKKESKVPKTNTVNNAGGEAYSLDNQEALAQLVCTGTFNNTFYTKGEDQLDQVIDLAKKVDPDFLMKLAIYAREHAYMKDSPAVLLAVLSTVDIGRFKVAANRVLDNMKMIRNLITVIRSGKVGRKSLGSAIRKYIRRFIEKMTDEKLINQSIGENPSLRDILCLVHPKPTTPSREAYYKYLFGKDYNKENLPQPIKELEAFKNGSGILPKGIDWQFLTAHGLNEAHWKEIAPNMNWHAIRMNINNLQKNKVFDDKAIVKTLATKLGNKEIINKINLFPYQVFTTLLNIESPPKVISDALQDALDISVSNLPAFTNIDKLFICVDCSGSMSSSVTGNREGATSKVSCNQAAAVYAGAIAKVNHAIDTRVAKFDTKATELKLNLRDSMYTLSQAIMANGGGTSVSSAFDWINREGNIKKSDRVGIVIISDNESWADYHDSSRFGRRGTFSADILENITNKAKSVRTALIDIQPNTHTQVKDDKSVLNIGGFSDTVFTAIFNFFEHGDRKWTDHINSSVQLDLVNQVSN